MKVGELQLHSVMSIAKVYHTKYPDVGWRYNYSFARDLFRRIKANPRYFTEEYILGYFKEVVKR